VIVVLEDDREDRRAPGRGGRVDSAAATTATAASAAASTAAASAATTAAARRRAGSDQQRHRDRDHRFHVRVVSQFARSSPRKTSDNKKVTSYFQCNVGTASRCASLVQTDGEVSFSS